MKINKGKYASLILIITSLTAIVYYVFYKDDKMLGAKRVGILQIISHPVLDRVREGIIQGLQEKGFENGKTIVFDVQNAQGDFSTAQTIAKKFVQDQVDLIIPIGTQATQSAAKATQEIPIVFGAVLDPVGARVVNSIESPGRNVTGASDVIPYEKQLLLLRDLVPNVKRIGMVHNPGEQNSQHAINEIKDVCKKLSLELVFAPVAGQTEVLMAARSLASRVDALYTAADNTVNSAIDSVVKVSLETKKPFLVSDPESVKKGALATIGHDYFSLGKDTANLANEVLKGSKPQDLPVHKATNVKTYLNEKAINHLGIKPSIALVQSAIIEK